MTSFTSLTRRSFMTGTASLSALALAGCATTGEQLPAEQPISQYYLSMYAAMPNDRFPIPAVDLRRIPESHWRQEVADPTGERPGTLVVNTSERFLYLVQENGRAIRYGCGIGRDGFTWSGRADVGRKAAWPTWTPPPEMVARDPLAAPWANGMPGGLDNPLGARALYIYQDGRDTIYRIHGTNDPGTIGQAVSSGCVRLINQDVVDVYQRVPTGSPILVV